MKRSALNVVKVAAGIAGVVFLFAPVHTVTQVLICLGSFVVAIICSIFAGQWMTRTLAILTRLWTWTN
ncbi:MAG TPA: hypothetical protein VFL42_05710 [Terriglobales bacterium]|jgi:hypothetical protein|nr:hypothetical protein [Terriglobales bacterium]